LNFIYNIILNLKLEVDPLGSNELCQQTDNGFLTPISVPYDAKNDAGGKGGADGGAFGETTTRRTASCGLD